MGTPVCNRRFYRFGEFSLDARTGELTNAGTRTPLREQPLLLLLALLEQPGELVTREELVSRLWPAGTLVDFDRGLNKAINHLREALGDSAEQPNFIETFPRKGYRFIAPVTYDGQATEEEAAPEGISRRPRVRAWTIALAATIACLAIIIGLKVASSRHWIATRPQPAPPISALAVIPLENLSGDPEQEYFADGMTDALITDLAKMSSVRVIVAHLSHSLQGDQEEHQGDRTGTQRGRPGRRYRDSLWEPRADYGAVDPGFYRHALVGRDRTSGT